jgi:hypothetical protein
MDHNVPRNIKRYRDHRETKEYVVYMKLDLSVIFDKSLSDETNWYVTEI